MIVGRTRTSRHLLAIAHGNWDGSTNVHAVDRRLAAIEIHGERFELEEVEQIFPADLVDDFDLIDELFERPDWDQDVDFFDDEYDALSDPDLPGWGTAIQWSDLHHFTNQEGGEQDAY